MIIQFPSFIMTGIALAMSFASSSAYSSQDREYVEHLQEPVAPHTLSVKKGDVSFLVGEKIGVYTEVCKISSVRFGTKYKCVKNFVSDGKVVGQRADGEWLVQLPQEIKMGAQMNFEKYSILKKESAQLN